MLHVSPPLHPRAPPPPPPTPQKHHPDEESCVTTHIQLAWRQRRTPAMKGIVLRLTKTHGEAGVNRHISLVEGSCLVCEIAAFTDIACNLCLNIPDRMKQNWSKKIFQHFHQKPCRKYLQSKTILICKTLVHTC